MEELPPSKEEEVASAWAEILKSTWQDPIDIKQDSNILHINVRSRTLSHNEMRARVEEILHRKGRCIHRGYNGRYHGELGNMLEVFNIEYQFSDDEQPE